MHDGNLLTNGNLSIKLDSYIFRSDSSGFPVGAPGVFAAITQFGESRFAERADSTPAPNIKARAERSAGFSHSGSMMANEGIGGA